MFAPVRHIAIGMCLLGSLGAAVAQSSNEDDDLKRIPHPAEEASANSESTPNASRSGQRIRIEDAFTGWDTRTLAVPVPTAQPTWQNRLSLDADIKLPVSE